MLVRSLTYSATNLPSGASFNAATRTFSWTPTTSQTGTYTVTFTATDGSLSASTTGTIVIGVADHAPVITAIPAQTVAPGNILAFTVKATDADGDPLTYSASNIPSRAVFRTSTQDFLWVPTSSQAGTYTVTFTVNDGKLTSSTVATITVT